MCGVLWLCPLKRDPSDVTVIFALCWRSSATLAVLTHPVSDTFSSFEKMGFVFMAHRPEVSVTNCPYYTTVAKWTQPAAKADPITGCYIPAQQGPTSKCPVPEKPTSFSEKGLDCCCICFKFQSVSQVCDFCSLPLRERDATIMKWFRQPSMCRITRIYNSPLLCISKSLNNTKQKSYQAGENSIYFHTAGKKKNNN